MNRFCDSIDHISFLARAESRVRVLHHLSASEPVKRRALTASLSQSRSAIVRAVDSLEERGWVTEDTDGLRLTPIGTVVIEEFFDLVESIGTVTELEPFLEWFPLSAHEIGIDDLRDGSVTVAVDGDPYAPVRKHTDLIRSADQFRALLPSIGQDAITEAYERILSGGLESSLIVSSSVETWLRTGQFAPELEEMLSTGRLTVHVVESVPFFLGLGDDRTIQIGVEDDGGLPRALFETTNESLRAWGDTLFAEYRESATNELTQL